MAEIENLILLRDLEYRENYDRETINAFRYSSLSELLNKFDDLFIPNRFRCEAFFNNIQEKKNIHIEKKTDNYLFFSSYQDATSMSLLNKVLTYLNNKSGYYSHINNTFEEWIDKAKEYSIETSEYSKKFEDIIKKSQENNEINNFLKFYDEIDELSIKLYERSDQIKEEAINLNEDFSYQEIIRRLQDPDTQKYQSIDFFDALMESKKALIVGVQSLIDELLIDIQKVLPMEMMTEAEIFIESKQKSGISGFIEQKQTNDRIKLKLDMTKAQTIQSLVLFDDLSLAIKDKHDNYQSYNSLREVKSVMDTFYTDYIGYKLRKKPLYSSVFRDLFEKTGSQKAIAQTVRVINTLLDNYDVLKQKDLSAIMNNINKNYKSEYALEMLDDIFNNIMREHKIKQFAQSIISNKYIHLYNEESYEKFAEMIESGVTKDFIQQNIGKKLASFKTSEDFNHSLSNIISLFNHFDIETIQQRAQESDTRLVSIKDNKMILEVKNFDQSKKMGSPSWCISRDDYYFDSYTKEGNRQYFVYDFNLESSNHKSMIGITIEPGGSVKTTHLKDDTYVSERDPLVIELAQHINQIERELKQKNTIKIAPN